MNLKNVWVINSFVLSIVNMSFFPTICVCVLCNNINKRLMSDNT